ncbi:hypothetical protein TIFTF001_009789 [Ficus carica]|uniref:Non-specific lipid-transfer protein n=1 Tax=Ficus carica TaxID=3494 RepID=A0AA87ZUC0_FICCA|nr:hypothetical protein TIFTF001_009789 [Ficus carica]
MASSSVVKLVVCLAIMAMVVGGAPLADALTCGQVSSSLAPCISYLRTGGTVPAACCNGIKSLNAAAKTTADRQAACNCIKSASKSINGINFSLAAGLPGKCGVSIPYKISPNTDCKSVK